LRPALYVAALAVQKVECVTHVSEKLVGGGKAAVLIKTVIIGFIRVWDNKVRFVPDANPIGQFIGERVTITKAVLDWSS
jgi:hypothetical protein